MKEIRSAVIRGLDNTKIGINIDPWESTVKSICDEVLKLIDKYGRMHSFVFQKVLDGKPVINKWKGDFLIIDDPAGEPPQASKEDLEKFHRLVLENIGAIPSPIFYDESVSIREQQESAHPLCGDESFIKTALAALGGNPDQFQLYLESQEKRAKKAEERLSILGSGAEWSTGSGSPLSNIQWAIDMISQNTGDNLKDEEQPKQETWRDRQIKDPIF